MVGTLRSASLSGIASGLRTMAGQLDTAAEELESVFSAVEGHLQTIAAAWNGDRAGGTLEATNGYVDDVAPAPGAITSVASSLRRLATTADQIAVWMEPYEQTISDIGWHQWAGIEVTPQQLNEAAVAERRHAQLGDDWSRAAAQKALDLESDVATLTGAHGAFASGFPSSLRGDELAVVLLQYAAEYDVELSTIDPSGALEERADELTWFMLNTGIGDMYYDVIETMDDDDGVTDTDGETSDGDLEVGTFDREKVEARVLDWAEAHGYEFDAATVAYMTTQIMLTAGAMASSEDDPWNDFQASVAGAGRDAVLTTVSPLPGDVALDLISVEDDPVTTAAWWARVPSTTAAGLVDTRSPVVGNLNGLPAVARDDANRRQLDRDIAELEPLEADGELTEEQEEVLENARAVRANLETATALEDPLGADSPTVQLYAYVPGAFEGDGRAAIAIGDLDTAEHVAVSVPGFSSEVAGMDPQRAYNVYRQARFASGDTVAVVDWMGYDAPNFDVGEEGIDGVVDGSGVIDQGAANSGATLLADDIEGIDAMRPRDDPHLTVIGNSYGSTTVAVAASERGLAAADVILTGSPGAAGAESAADFTTGTENTWVASASSDFVTYLGHSDGGIRVHGALGDDPAMDTFGANRIQAERYERGTAVNIPAEHGGYFANNSESLYNIGLIVGGESEQVLDAEHREQEPFVEVHPLVLPGESFWQFRLQAPVEVNLWPVEPEAEREPTLQTSDPVGPGG